MMIITFTPAMPNFYLTSRQQQNTTTKHSLKYSGVIKSVDIIALNIVEVTKALNFLYGRLAYKGAHWLLVH